MKGQLDIYLDKFIFDDEGETFEVRDTEPGGAVKLGVSMQAYREWKKDETLPFDTLEKMGRDEARLFYRDMFWDPTHCDNFPLGVDYAILDPMLNSGKGAGLAMLVAALHMPANVVFSETNSTFTFAIPAPLDLCNRICDARIAHMKQTPGWALYEKGWTARVSRVRQRCIDIIGGKI